MASVDFSEVLSLVADFHKESDQVEQRAGMVITKVSLDTQRDAQILAPVDTGALRNSVGVSFRVGQGTMRGEIGPTVHYGIYQELGTSRMRAQPYLFPAADRHEPAFYEAMSQVAEPKW